MSNFHRIQWIDSQIKADRYPNIKKLIELFEISQRQAYRDIEYMKDSLYAPIKYSKKFKGYYYEDNSFNLPSIQITENQKNMLNFLAIQYERYSDENSKQLANVFAKLVGEKENKKKINIPMIRVSEKIASLFELINKAVKDKKQIIIEYKTVKYETKKRQISPYLIFSKYTHTYLVGYCHLREDIRNFRLDRIKTIKITNEDLYECPYFNENDYKNDNISFNEKKSYISKIKINNYDISKSEYKVHKKNDYYIFEFDNSNEFMQYLFSLNKKIEILYPKWLKEKMVKRLNLLLRGDL